MHGTTGEMGLPKAGARFLSSVSPNMIFIWKKLRLGAGSVAPLTPRSSRWRYPLFVLVQPWISGANAEDMAEMCNFSHVAYDFIFFTNVIQPDAARTIIQNAATQMGGHH